ncbi:ATP-binding protein [Aureimonas sp. SK2]|uniref:sensor histidine kinase n=1 Tax=Aureimonas sp. SK2 TaxID=3015992 RepID=UPI0024439572|nr:ATP-binding protein [Aureimonas sp. SK2]
MTLPLTLPRHTVFRLASAGGLVVLAVMTWLAAGALADRATLETLGARARTSLPLAMAVLRSEVDKQRSVPAILSEDPDIRDVLAAPAAASVDRVNRKLEDLRRTTGATVLYLLDAAGLTIAASNYAEPTSFVGSDYAFRPYFTEAMRSGAAAQYALGTVSRRSGLYITRRVDVGDRALGVVVLKVEFSAIERDWAAGGDKVFVTDANGIVLATSEADWHYRALAPVPPDLAVRIRDSLQFGAAPLTPLGIERRFGTVRAAATGNSGRFVEAAEPLDDPLLAWTLHLWVPADAALAQARLSYRLQALAGLLATGTGGFLLLRRRRSTRLRQEALRAASQELERRVEERTGELREANRLLVEESATRQMAEERAEALRRSLDQANRLASLGQITAGVAHEINQPVAAIRTYAENAERFLERGDVATTQRNLRNVVGLTERIGRITDTLKGHARRGTNPLEPVNLAEAVDGAVMVLQGRIDAAGIPIARDPALARFDVLAERVRLEQVLVNLLQNALDAMEDRKGGRIEIVTAAEDGWILLSVRDTGPGIPPDRLATLFTPFSTSKPRGLGLGLVIAKDILSEWGGTLDATSRPGEGATFTASLRIARP